MIKFSEDLAYMLESPFHISLSSGMQTDPH